MKKNWKVKPYLETAWVKKMWLIMKTAFVFLFVTLVQASGSVYSQNTKLTINMRNVTIEQVIKEIKKNSEFDFVFDYDLIERVKAVSIDAKNAGIEEILDECLKETNLNFKIDDKVIMLLPTTEQQVVVVVKDDEKITIRGTVTDRGGEAIIGANVYIKGTTIGTITDINGEYTIDVEKDNIIVFSFIGMISHEEVVTGKRVLIIELKADVSELDDIVVVGFGSQKKESVVGSMSTIKPAELKIPSSNLTTALAGRISGIISHQSSGEPGKDNAQFFVRGITTFAQGAGPLILIDGVELTANDLARLNPDDIESFSVMKDATSTAVYGARGANGVIYVVTKSGVEGKAQVNFRVENSFSTNTMMPKIANGITYMEKYNEAVLTRIPGALAPFSDEKIYNTKNNTNPNMFPNVDWQKEMIKDWTRNNRFNVSVRGGGKIARYYIAGNYSQDNGILKDDPLGNIENNIKLRKYLLRCNVDFDLTKTTKAVIRLHSTFDEFKGPSVGAGNLFAQTGLTSPVRFPAVYKADAKNVNTPNILFGNELISKGNYYVNPYHQLVSGFKKSSNSLNLVQIELKQDLGSFVDGLKMRFLGNNNRTSYYSLVRNTDPFFYQAKLADYDPLTNEYELTRLNDNGNRALSFRGGETIITNALYGELAFDYLKQWGPNTVNGMVVGTVREYSTSKAESLEASLPSRNLGVSGRFTYDYENKYFAEVNFGLNGSERFAKNNRYGFFPSMGVGWLISKEEFFENVNPNFISKLKLKASYGIVGNDRIGDDEDRFFYRSQVNINSFNGYVWGHGENRRSVRGIDMQNYANEEISWETATTTNLGLELDLAQGAFQVRAEYFTQERRNILQNRLLPASLGLQVTNKDGSSVRHNVGTASIKGVDLSIDGNKSWNNGAWVSLRGTLTYSASEITHFEEPNYALQNSPYRAVTGTTIGQQFGYIAERLFIDQEEIDNSPTQAFGISEPSAGDIKYKDINNDGVINDLDKVAIGHPDRPQITFGAGFSAGYKNFDLSMFFQGNARVSMFIDPLETAPFVQGYRDEDQLTNGYVFNRYMFERGLLQEFADNHWTEANPNPYAEYPRLSTYPQLNNLQGSTYWMRDASFVRLKQLELGYNLRDFQGINNIRFYASGTNLLTWSKFKLWDPEMGGKGFNYPIQKVFNLGVSVTF